MASTHTCTGGTEVYTKDWFIAKEQLPQQEIILQLKNFNGLPHCQSLVLALGIEFGLPINYRLVKTIPENGVVVVLAAG